MSVYIMTTYYIFTEYLYTVLKIEISADPKLFVFLIL